MTQARYDQLPAPQHEAFLDLAVAHSPENLAADGENSMEMQQRMHQDLLRQWKALESAVGFTVKEDEVWHREQAEKQDLRAKRHGPR